jgi:hypothetical protein
MVGPALVSARTKLLPRSEPAALARSIAHATRALIETFLVARERGDEYVGGARPPRRSEGIKEKKSAG